MSSSFDRLERAQYSPAYFDKFIRPDTPTAARLPRIRYLALTSIGGELRSHAIEWKYPVKRIQRAYSHGALPKMEGRVSSYKVYAQNNLRRQMPNRVFSYEGRHSQDPSQ